LDKKLILDMRIISQMRILCVEDEPQALSQLSLSLESFCKELYCAKDGQEALDILDLHEVDVIITDLRMPRVDGLELLEIVKKRYKDITVIIVSAHSESDYLLKAIRLRADGYILKPLNLQELFSLIIRNAGSKVLENELSNKNLLLKVLQTIGGKRVQIIEYIFNHLDKEKNFLGTYDEIIEALGASKPTVVNTFKVLIDDGILIRVKNGHYKLRSDLFV
jgi:YesN/AraC family two-component response regulator